MTDKPYATSFNHLTDLKDSIGKELGLTKWNVITQEKIKTFAELTGDNQWIHIDEKRCVKESPYKHTIAHGFLMLSMCSKIMYDTYEIKQSSIAINYGLDKVRFTNATPSGSKYRGRVSLMEFDPNQRGAKYKMKVTIEIKGQEKPSCIAELLALAYKK